MADIVGIYAASHGPLIVRKWNALSTECRHTLTTAYGELGRRINAARADVLIVISPDHWVNFFIDNLPSICVGVGETHDGPPEPWLADFPHKQIAGHAPLAQHIVEFAFTHNFEPSVSYKLALDHGFCIPLWKAGVAPLPAIVPVVLNTLESPYPSVRRCFEWGTVIADAISCFADETRVAILATGGLSHSIGEATMGAIDEDFDRECMQHLASGEINTLFDFLDQRMLAAGNGAAEVRNWVAAHGVARARGFDLIHYSAMPEIYVGCGVASWDVAKNTN
jgi:aromatic ring-opening dioxygenase catalytic subunit (LigB family)